MSSPPIPPAETTSHTLGSPRFDVIVIGSGNAGSSAALSAIDNGCKQVLLIDKCPPEWVGGNSYFTAGAYRTVHDGLTDILEIIPNVDPEFAATIDMEPYTNKQFTEDITRLSNGRSNPALVEALVDGSHDTILWLSKRIKIPFTLSFHRQAYLIDGRQKFWGGMVLAIEGRGKGLVSAHHRALKESGIKVYFNTEATDLVLSNGRVSGLKVKRGDEVLMLEATAIILASGGFESSREMRHKYLGSEWVNARVRGTPHNTGETLLMAQRAGAAFQGDWGGCHSTCWDANTSTDAGDRVLSNQFTKSGYPLGIMVNADGHRFVDEGEDFRNYTYAKFGREILEQKGGYAFQIYDAKVTPWLRKEEYADDVVEKVVAQTIGELAEKLSRKGLENPNRFLETLQDFNEAVCSFTNLHPEKAWDPAVKDGLSTGSSLEIPKSNWAQTIEQPPFVAVKVATGVTFTFGGLSIDPNTAGVISSENGAPIIGLFAAREIVGGLFYSNYPGGSGLTSGAVFGGKAGKAAAALSYANANI
ncbi:FAD/NAD-P-binding domain-containing protein [Thelephora ganbajun]|uniref:FAD/NAD-P-binding domain-containing protein n=1 Tax=Thelephora ganbajun TaxID=370292 RepID=A0ACB6ZP52_THEGA|nr:FAD/NAD-P-binding domain-containing protein [Thelephora ganbajun]